MSFECCRMKFLPAEMLSFVHESIIGCNTLSNSGRRMFFSSACAAMASVCIVAMISSIWLSCLRCISSFCAAKFISDCRICSSNVLRCLAMLSICAVTFGLIGGGCDVGPQLLFIGIMLLLAICMCGGGTCVCCCCCCGCC